MKFIYSSLYHADARHQYRAAMREVEEAFERGGSLLQLTALEAAFEEARAALAVHDAMRAWDEARLNQAKAGAEYTASVSNALAEFVAANA